MCCLPLVQYVPLRTYVNLHMGRRSLGLPNLKVDDFGKFCRAPTGRCVGKREGVEVYVQGPTHVAKYEARKT